MKITEICAALEALECARDKATPGPWKWDEDTIVDSHGRWIVGAAPCGYENSEVVISDIDLAFILGIRNFPISFRKIAEILRAAKDIHEMPWAGHSFDAALERLDDEFSDIHEVKP
jgi:hypothetical protein